LAFLAKIGTEPENLASRLLRFQRLRSLKTAGILPRTANADQSAFP
jgi:hypothetical protein